MNTPHEALSESEIGRLRELIDREEIYDLLMTFSRGVDRGDFALARSVYHEDALDHHTGFDGTAADFMDWLPPRMQRLKMCQHLLANVMVEIQGNRAVAESYGMMVRRGNAADEPVANSRTGFRYVDKLEKRGGKWGISERWVVREWQCTDIHSMMPKEADGPDGQRSKDDILYEALKFLAG